MMKVPVLLFLVFLSTASAIRKNIQRRHMVFHQGNLQGVFGHAVKNDQSTVAIPLDEEITNNFKVTKNYIETVQDAGGKDNIVCQINIKRWELVGNSTDPKKNHVKVEYGYKFKGESKEGKAEFGGQLFVGAEGTAFSKTPLATVGNAVLKYENKASSKGFEANDFQGLSAQISSLVSAEVEVKLAKIDEFSAKAAGQAGVTLSVAFKINWENATLSVGGKVFSGVEAEVTAKLRWVVFSLKGFCGAGVEAKAEIKDGEAGFAFGVTCGVGTGVEVKVCYAQIVKDAKAGLTFAVVRGGEKLRQIKKDGIKKAFKDTIQGNLKKYKTKYKAWKIEKMIASGKVVGEKHAAELERAQKAAKEFDKQQKKPQPAAAPKKLPRSTMV